MNNLHRFLAFLLAFCPAVTAQASGHRDAPIVALDRAADITDVFAFRSYDNAPTPPRNDLLPLFTYAPPIAAPGTPGGPVADLLRLNTGVLPTPPASASRLGLLGGDPLDFPTVVARSTT
jgi:hypothetical protein